MLPAPTHIHFLGICGTAMGAVAAALARRSLRVTGSDDNVYPPMSTYLESHGVAITRGYRPENLPSADPGLLVVIGNAISRGNPEVEAVLDRRLHYLSLPEALRELFLRGRTNLVVTGTHGKTTTTSLLTWILDHAGLAPDHLIGGLPRNFPHGGARLTEAATLTVLEGDEYDTAFFDKRSKFLHYLPHIVVLNNLEFDHADIFRDLDDIKLTFRRMINIIPRSGHLIVNADDPHALEAASHSLATLHRLGTGPLADPRLRIENIAHHGPNSTFRLLGHDFTVPLTGDFNVRNTAMAIAAAHFHGLPLPAIAAALPGFLGVARRQDIYGEADGILLVDDFGHHPTAIRETLRALRHTHPGRRLWAIFEPRSNTTRRAVFQHDLPDALAHADAVILAQVARLDQLPSDQRLDPARVVADLNALGKPAYYEPDPDTIIRRLLHESRPGDLLAIFSNGGFGGLHPRLLQALRDREAARPPA